MHGTLLSTMDACSFMQPWPYLYFGRRHVETIYSNLISRHVYWWPKILESNNKLSITVLILTYKINYRLLITQYSIIYDLRNNSLYMILNSKYAMQWLWNW